MNQLSLGDIVAALGGGVVAVCILAIAAIISIMWIVFPVFVFSRLGRIATASENTLYEIRKLQSVVAGSSRETVTAESDNPFKR
jgi:hypothetical protein